MGSQSTMNYIKFLEICKIIFQSNVYIVYEISKTLNFLQRPEKVKVNIKTLVYQKKRF